jgi:two-component system cell cycle response regulator
LQRKSSDIIVYEKDRDSLGFLTDFFADNKGYSAEFISNLREIKKRLRNTPPDALITGSPSCVDKIGRFKDTPCPVIAMVSKDVTGGIRGVVDNEIEHYLLAPYHRGDLAYRLKLVTRKRGLLEKVRQGKKDAEAVADLTYIISSTLDPQRVLYLIVKKLSELIPVSRCSILSLDLGDAARATVVSSFENPSIKHLELDLVKYPEIRKALRTRKPVVVKDARSDPLMNRVRSTIEPLGVRSIVVVPVIFRSEVIGTLFLRTSSDSRHFSDREVRLCKRIASAAANALYNAFLYEEVRAEREELQKLAITDFLTGVYNIRYLYHRLDDEFGRAIRYGQPLSCLMMDIDHFKTINDTYGHRTGDRVLREFAELIRGLTRKSDVFARYGGEEFIMLLPHTPMKGALSEGRRVAEAVRRHRFKGIKDTIKMSVGVACFPDRRIKTQDDLIRLADDGLMKAKKGGRDRVAVFS